MKIDKFICERCKYEWIPRAETPPKKCPNCYSRNWNKKSGEMCQDMKEDTKQVV